jgi:hypothetical protein
MLLVLSVPGGARAAADATAPIDDLLGELVDRDRIASAAEPRDFFSAALSLTQQRRWPELSRLAAQAPSAVAEPLRHLIEGYAEFRSGDTGRGLAAMRAALAAAAARGQLPALASVADQLGARSEFNQALLELCRDPAAAGDAFDAVRWRVRDPGAVETAYQTARQVAPRAASVGDYRRYRALLDGRPVERDEIRAAVAAAPDALLPRITLALAGLRSERPADAWSAFDDVVVMFAEAPPGAQAVISAACAADGQDRRAAAMAMEVDMESLLPAEYALIAPLRAGTMSAGLQEPLAMQPHAAAQSMAADTDMPRAKEDPVNER